MAIAQLLPVHSSSVTTCKVPVRIDDVDTTFPASLLIAAILESGQLSANLRQHSYLTGLRRQIIEVKGHSWWQAECISPRLACSGFVNCPRADRKGFCTYAPAMQPADMVVFAWQ